MRRGPNVVGAFGFLQSVADALKYIVKEVVVPAGADKAVFMLRPIDQFRAGDDCLGGHSVQRRLGLERYQRCDPVCLCGVLARGLRRDYGGVGVQLEIPVPRIAALGRADDFL